MGNLLYISVEIHTYTFFNSHVFVCVSLAIVPKGKPWDSQGGDIAVPHFRRGKEESEKAYVRRMENETKHVLFLTKNQVERKPELDADEQERPADKGKSEKKKE